jgi:hypothetical protein
MDLHLLAKLIAVEHLGSHIVFPLGLESVVCGGRAFENLLWH